ncbi:MAG: hypothetical protein AB7F59_14485 [Bdellovibrionales bacterium]
MKTLIILFALFFSFASEASFLPTHATGQLEVVRLDQNHFSHLFVNSAYIVVDDVKKSVHLIVHGIPKITTMECRMSKDSKGCLPPPAIAEDIELPIISDERTRCGTRKIVAAVDDRPVDGLFSSLEIVEKRSLAGNVRCMDAHAEAGSTRVVYTTSIQTRGSAVFTWTSYFQGQALVYPFQD